MALNSQQNDFHSSSIKNTNVLLQLNNNFFIFLKILVLLSSKIFRQLYLRKNYKGASDTLTSLNWSLDESNKFLRQEVKAFKGTIINKQENTCFF